LIWEKVRGLCPHPLAASPLAGYAGVCPTIRIPVQSMNFLLAFHLCICYTAHGSWKTYEKEGLQV
jgi:hypothetical protein